MRVILTTKAFYKPRGKYMYSLDVPKMIKSSFHIDTKSVASENGYDVINISGFASKMYDSNGKYVVDADQEIVNTAKVDLKRLKLGRLPLLFQHDQKLIVGSVLKAEYRPEGLYVEAQVVKFPDDPVSSKVYHGVRSGVLNSFSIGALVKNFDVFSQDQEDYLVLDETELIELSIVTVPSNAESGFRVLSAYSKGLSLSKTVMKELNADICDDFSCAISKAFDSNKKETEMIKGLTLEETLNSSWMGSRQFGLYLDALVETIQDNYFANKWDELPPQEAKTNIIEAFSEFISSKVELQEVPKAAKGLEMEIKSTEVENKETVLGATDGALETLEKITNGELTSEPEVNHNGETVEAPASEGTPSLADDKPSETPIDESKQTREDASIDNQEKPTDTPKGTEEPKEISLDSVENFIGNLDLDTVDVSDLEKLLNLAEMINIAVEAKVKEQLSLALQATA